MTDLYRDVILDHYKNPRNKGTIDSPDMHAHEDNVVCGDTVDFFLTFDDNEKVKEVKWDGQGCALSQASASLLSQMITSKNKVELEKISEKDIFAIVGEDLHPSRQKCATLSLLALKSALEQKND